MKLTRRSLLLGATALGTAPMMAACGGQSSAPSQGITVGLTFIPNVQFSPFYVAESEGLFKDAGIELALRHHGTQEGLFTALTSGDEQVVFASSDEAVVAAAEGITNLQTFATCYQKYPGVLLANQAIMSLSELAGRTIGVPGGYGSSWFTALAALDAAGLAQDDVEIAPIGWTQVSALSTEKVDAVVGFSNNEAVQLRTAGYPFNQFDVIDLDEPKLVGPGLMVLAETVEMAMLKAIVDAVGEAESRIVANPELALKATEAYVPTLTDSAQREQAALVLEATAAMWTDTSGSISLGVSHDNFDRMGTFLTDAGIITTAPSQVILDLD